MKDNIEVNRLPAPTMRHLGVNSAILPLPPLAPQDIRVTGMDIVSPYRRPYSGEVIGGMGQSFGDYVSGCAKYAYIIEGNSTARIDYVKGACALDILVKGDATVIVEYSGEAVSLSSLRFMVGEGSSLHLIGVNWGAYAAQDIGIAVEDRASVKYTGLLLGGSDSYLGLDVELMGHKCSFDGSIGYVVRDKERLDVNYIARHKGTYTKSALKINGVLSGNSVKVLRDTIDFVSGSKGAIGDEEENVLLLSPDVSNKSVPLILCSEEDVEGRHGASIGRAPEGLLFYMRSRGIDESGCLALLRKARLRTVVSRIDDAALGNRLDQYIECL